jgi:hypothetical protein
MPNIGDICRAHDLGKVGGRQYIWTECPDCRGQRWAVIKTLDRSAYRQCQDCVRAKAKRVFKIGRALGH